MKIRCNRTADELETNLSKEAAVLSLFELFFILLFFIKPENNLSLVFIMNVTNFLLIFPTHDILENFHLYMLTSALN